MTMTTAMSTAMTMAMPLIPTPTIPWAPAPCSARPSGRMGPPEPGVRGAAWGIGPCLIRLGGSGSHEIQRHKPCLSEVDFPS